MAGKTLVGQRSEIFYVFREMGPVDVDDIVFQIINGRKDVVSRIGIFLHRFRYVVDFKGKLAVIREIGGNFGFQLV